MKKFLTSAFVAAMAVAPMLAATTAEATCKYNCGPKGSSGSGSAYFGGNVFSENLAGAQGDLTFAKTMNWKEESGAAGVSTGTGKPTSAYGVAHVATGGTGMSGAMSLGFGGSIANSGVGGHMAGDAFAGFETE